MREKICYFFLLCSIFLQADEIELYGSNGKLQQEPGGSGGAKNMVFRDKERNLITASFSEKWPAVIFRDMIMPNGVFGEAKMTFEIRAADKKSVGAKLNCGFRIIDTYNKPIPYALSKESSQRSISLPGEWKPFSYTTTLPKGVRILAGILIGNNNGIPFKLEIRNARIVLSGFDPVKASILGVSYPRVFGIPGRGCVESAKKDQLDVELFHSVPFKFDDPFWKQRPEYQLQDTKFDKKSPSRKDHLAWFKIAADSKSIYLYCHAEDDVLNFSGSDIYENDCFEFFLNPSGGFKESGLRCEQYTISRTELGKTTAKNTQGITRLIPGGWEALLQIPLKNYEREIRPFHGLRLSANVIYQDADTVPQEHYLSFSSKDKGNLSWAKPEVHIPLIFHAAYQTYYKPYILPAENMINLEPKYTGRINLTPQKPSFDTLGFWDYPETASLSTDGEVYRLTYRKGNRLAPVILVHPGFAFYAGETLECQFDARISKGTAPVPALGAFSFSNWRGSQSTIKGIMSEQWKTFKGRIRIRDHHTDNSRSGFFFIGNWNPYDWNGRTVEVRNFRVTRCNPTDLDAQISFPGVFADFGDDDIPDLLTFRFDSLQKRNIVITAEAKDPYSGKKHLSFRQKFSLPVGQTEIPWDVSKLPRGFFNVLLDVFGTDGKHLIHRELYITKSLHKGCVNPAAGIWGSPFQTAPRRPALIAAFLKRIGIGTFYINNWNAIDKNGKPLEFNCDRDWAQAMKENGIQVSTVLYRYNPLGGSQEQNQADGVRKIAEAQFRAAGNCIDIWNFQNESNLDGGWRPEPDGREWALLHRVAYAVAKKRQPQAKFMFGNVNGFPLDYFREAWKENGKAFSDDGLLGVHLYNIDVNGNAFDSMLKNRQELEKLYPGWRVWDTESGLVHHNSRQSLELQTKRLPLQMCAGVMRHYFYAINDLVHPYGDSTALVPAEAFKNRFLHEVEPEGRLTTGTIHLYLFRKKNGRGAAVFWNTALSTQKQSFPMLDGAKHYDQYGNLLGTIQSNIGITFHDRFVHYAENFDLEKAKKNPKFIAAFHSPYKEPQKSDVREDVLILPDPVTRNLSHELASHSERKISLYFLNYSDKPVSVAPYFEIPEGVRIPKGLVPFRLKPEESRILEFSLIADSAFRSGHLLAGAVIDGQKKVCPVVFELRGAPLISLEGKTQSVLVGNNGNVPTDLSVRFKGRGMIFPSGRIQVSGLKPGEKRVIPLVIDLPEAISSKGIQYAPVQFYTITSSIGNQDIKASGRAVFFKKLSQKNIGKIPLIESSSGTYRVRYAVFSVPQGLRILAEADDSTPFQTGKRGALRSEGDCFVVALESEPGIYRQYGFAPLKSGFTSYEWNGTFGLENTASADKYVHKIQRDGKKILYDVTIPFNNACKRKRIPFSLLFIDRNANRSDFVELGGGILKRNTADMGLLLE